MSTNHYFLKRMNDALLYAGREKRLTAFEPNVIEELKQKEQQLGRPGYVDDVLDEGSVQKWLASRTGQSAETIQANAPGIIRNYFGQDLSYKQAYNLIVEVEQLARIGVSASLAPAAAPSPPAASAAPDQNDADTVDYGDFQALRAAGSGFQEMALMVPYGTFSFLDGVMKRVTGDGAEPPMLTTPDNDRYLANLAKDAVAAGQRREDIRRNAGIDPGYDAEGKAAIELYQSTIALVNKANKAKVKAWVDKQESTPFRQHANFWLELAEETDARMGVDPKFLETSFGQFAKMAGSLPATAALSAIGYGGLVAMGAMTFGGEELARRQVEGDLFDPAAAVGSVATSSLVQAKIENLMKWDDVFKGAFGKIQTGGKATMKDFAKQVVIVSAGEGLEEPTQGLVSDTVASLTYDESRNPLTLEALERRVWEGVAGTIGGTLMAGTFGAAGALDQNRRAKRAGEYLTNKMGGPLNVYDFNAARAAFNDAEILAMADGTTLLKAVNGDAQAQKDYNNKLAQGKFISLYGARIGTSQFGYVLTATRQMPAILEDNGTITIVDPTNKKAVETWGEALQLHKAKADLLEEETISDLIDYVRDLTKARPDTSSVTVSTPKEVGFAPSLAEQANNDPVRAREIYDRYVEIGLLPAGLDPMSPSLRTMGSSETIYDDVAKTFKTIIKIYKGADPLVVIEENSEDAIKRELATGRVTRTRINFWRQAVEGTQAAALSTDEAAIEWVSKYTVAYAIGKAQGNESKMPKSFLDFVQKVAYRIRQSLQLAARVLELENNGQLPADLQAFMRGALGISDVMATPSPAMGVTAVLATGAQQQQTDSTTAPADPVAVIPNEFGIMPTPVDELPQDEGGSAVGGYISLEDLNNPEYDASDEVIEPMPELPPELEAYDEEIDQMYGDTVTEMPIISQEGDGFVVRHPNSERMDENVYATYEGAKRAAQNYFETMERAVITQQIAVENTSTSRDELMSAVLRIGHLISPSQEPTFGGELRMIWNNLGFGQAMKTFRKKALELDALRQELNSPNYGFNYETVTEMLDALIDSSGGKPQYPKNNRIEEFQEFQVKKSTKTFSLAESYVNENNTPESQKPKAILEIATLLASAEDERLDRTTYSLSQGQGDGIVSQQAAQTALSSPGQKETLGAAFAEGSRILSVFSDLVKQPSGSWDIRGAVMKSPRDLLTFTNAMRSPYVETVKILLLNSSDVVVYSQIASIGSINEVVMSPDIMRRVISAAPQLPAGQGYRVIISHNHPSGVVTPSSKDNGVTLRMIDTLRVLGHEFADHIITNGDTFYSYRAARMISGTTGTVTNISPAEIGLDINTTAPVQWEVLSKPMPYTIKATQDLSRIVEAARASSEDSMHVVYTDNQMGVVAIERIPEFANVPPANLIRQISATATSQGATGVGIGMPQSYDMDKTRGVTGRMKQALADVGITLYDVTYDSAGTAVSMHNLGLMEKPASYSPTTFSIRSEPGFHSRLSEVVQSKVQGKSVTIEQLKSLINNPQAGIKAGEIKWSGINDMLDEMSKTSTKVDKQDVLDYLDRQIKTKFIQYVGQEEVPAALNELAASFGYTVLSEYDEVSFQNKNGEVFDLPELPQDARVAIGEYLTSNPSIKLGYTGYVLGGGKNYREVVLAMPDSGKTRFEQLKNIGVAEMTDEQFEEYRTIEKLNALQKAYVSPHFRDAPGYVAHTRINDRDDDAGNPGLFLEEIQSDRHQSGRKRGYAVSVEQSAALNEDLSAARTEYDNLVSSRDSLQELQSTTPQGSPMQDKIVENLKNMEALVVEAREKLFSATEKVRSIIGLAPDAPFQKDWALQMFKRALRDAVAGGKSWIGWTTGQIQADRFDLSKQVDSVVVRRNMRGSWIIDGTKDGEGIISKEAFTIDEVEETIGGYLADKVANLPLDSEEQEFTGIDLKLGGEGMMGFYDDILPKEIGRYVKQWGAKVQKSELSVQPNLTNYYVEEGAFGTFWIMDSATSMEANIPFNGPFASVIEATNSILKPNKNPPKAQIWRVDINEQMREGVALKGQPTFSVGQSLNLAPADPAPVFYSRLIKTVEQSTQGKASGAQWKATIKNSKLGVNQDEFALVGVNDLEDGKTYTKAEVLEYLRANEIKVQDVTLGKPMGTVLPKILSDAGFVLDAGMLSRDGQVTGGQTLPPAMREAWKSFQGNPAQFERPDLQLPGAIEGSYREVLLTVPEKESDVIDRMQRLYEVRTQKEMEAISSEVLAANWKDGHSQYSGIENPIVRLRLNERTTADGKRMLFLEEVQAPTTQTGDFQKMPELFQKNWREIGFKWALRKAVDGGFDVLGWTTGEQQAERNDLRKQIKEVTAEKNDDGTVDLFTTTQWDQIDIKRDMPIESIGEYVGRELADKIIKQDGNKTYSGLDLKVGGEGLAKLYDVDFRNVVNGLAPVKKAGQKVGKAEISGQQTQFKAMQKEAGGRWFVENVATRKLVDDLGYKTEEQAKRAVAAMNGKQYSVNALELTDTIRESAMSGQTTFSLDYLGDYTRSPDPLFSTNNLKDLRREKDAWQAAGATPEVAMQLVEKFYDRQNYVGIPPDATLLPVPSTTGRNILPAALAQRISQDFGNKVFLEPAGVNMADKESKTKTRFFAKLADPVAFRPVAAGISKLIGVPVYVVEDVHNTGESWIGFTRMLMEYGIDVRGIVALGSAEQRLTSPRDIDRLSGNVASILQIGIDAVRPHLDDFFNGSYRKLFNLAAREIAETPALAGRLLNAAIAGGHRGSFRSPIKGQRRSTRRVQPAPANTEEEQGTTFSLGATTTIQVNRGRKFSPAVRDLLRRRQEGEAISREAIDLAIRETFPAAPVPIPTLETLPTKQVILSAIKSNQIKNSIDVSQIAVGTKVQLRQDVPAMNDYGVGVVVIHTENGNGYEASAAIDNVVFRLNEKVSLDIALGANKTPVVRAYGTWSADQSMPANLENWTQVGFNPDRHSFYYDRKTMRQVTGADRAFQVGNTVFAEGAKFGDGYVSDITYALKFTPGAISKVSSENDASRIGTSKKGTKARPLPTTQDDNISGDIIPEATLKKHLESMTKYHFVPASVRSARTPKLKVEALIRFLADNLIALHNAFPAEDRARATLWYDGANRLAREIAGTHNMTVEQASAILASFSPQKDWFMNVAQAEQFASIWNNSQDIVLSQEVVGGAIEDIVDAVVVPEKLKVKKQEGETKNQQAIRRAKNLKMLRRLQLERRKKLLPMLNKTIRQLDGESQAWAIRAYTQAKFGRDYRNLSPEGEHLGIAMLESEENTPAKNGWGSCLEIEKAVKIMQDGSLLNISKQLGNEHKVRSFYNNIVSPNSPYGDSTIDTHAIAAAWIMPYGSSAKAVKDNFGAASSSQVFGISGTYWIYLSAYRLAAKDLGLQPRQLQSITWEAIRLIYPSEGRNKMAVDANKKIWNNSLNETEARSRLIPGRVPSPVWARDAAADGYTGTPEAEQPSRNLPDARGNVSRGNRGSARTGRGRTTGVQGGSANAETFAARLQRQQQSVAQIDAEIRANLAVLQQHGTLYTETQGLAALAQMQSEGYDQAIATAARTNKILRRSGSAAAKLALPIDFRIERIIPELGRMLRQRSQQAGLRANQDNRILVAFFERLMAGGITNGMLAQLDHGLYNGHDDVVDNIVRQYGAEAQLTAVRAVFEQQMNEAIELGVPYRRFFIGELSDADQAGLDAAVRQARTLPAGQAGQTIVALVQAAGLNRSIESYWPRKVMNRDALLQTLGLPGVQDEYEKLLDRSLATATAAGRNLTEPELDALIDQANSNARRNRAPAGARTPGSLKARVIDVVSVEQMQYYYKGIDSAMRHNIQMRDHLETLRFFGASVVHAPSDIDFQVLPVDMGASVGAWVTDYELAGSLSTQQRAALMEMMVSRFNYQASPAFISALRSFSYLQNMTQITTWLTATIADTWTGFYDSGSSPYRYGKNFIKAMADLSEISTVDIGLNSNDLGAEFDKLQGLNPTLVESMRGLFSNLLTEQGRDNWTPGQAVTRLFDWFSKKVGLPYFERVTREAHMNSAVERLISQARSGTIPRKTQVKLERYFGAVGATRVILDLRAGRQNAADVQFFAFCILCDWKAVSLDQMPQGYLANPQGRVFYMYKTWIAAQFAGIYRSAGQDIASGNPAQVASGVATLLYLMLLMMAVGIPVDAIVAFVQGRPFILQDSAVNRMLGFIGTGRYVATLITRGEYGKAVTEYFAPPLGGAITDIQDDIEALWNLGLDVPIKNLKVWRNLPIVGRVYNGYLGNKAEENRQAIEKAGGQFALTAAEQPTRTDEEKAQMKKQRLAKEYGVGSN